MSLSTTVDTFHQSLAGATLTYRIATAVYPGESPATESMELGSAAVPALAPRGSGLQFALNLLSVPSARVPFEGMREIVRRGTRAARDAGLSVLGGHTLDIDAVLYSLLVVELESPGAASTTMDVPDPDPGAARRRVM